MFTKKENFTAYAVATDDASDTVPPSQDYALLSPTENTNANEAIPLSVTGYLTMRSPKKKEILHATYEEIKTQNKNLDQPNVTESQ